MTEGENMVERETDICVCGDYRRDHDDGHGACKHNKPQDLTHGYRDCSEFRLPARTALSQPNEEGEGK